MALMLGGSRDYVGLKWETRVRLKSLFAIVFAVWLIPAHQVLDQMAARTFNLKFDKLKFG